MLGMTVIMIMFVRYVRETEKTSKRRSLSGFGAEPAKRPSLASRTFWQSFYFLAVFYTVWPIQFMAFIAPLAEENYWIYLLAALLGPLQGFLNAAVVFYRDSKSFRTCISCGNGSVSNMMSSFFTSQRTEVSQELDDWPESTMPKQSKGHQPKPSSESENVVQTCLTDNTYAESDATLEFAMSAGLLDDDDTALYQDRISALGRA